MNQGKRICDILKNIRKNVSEKTNVKLEQTECNYKRNCNGTCPKCEAELSKINKNIDNKVLLSVISALGITIALIGCSSDKNDIDNNIIPNENSTILGYEKLEGDISLPITDNQKDNYLFSEEDINNKEIMNIDSLEISPELKEMLKNTIQKNKLRGLIKPNVKPRF